MQTLFVMFAVLTLGATLAATLPFSSRRTNSQENGIKTSRRAGSVREKDWLKIAKAPEIVITVKLGDRLEVVCEASGSPAPTVEWIEGCSTDKYFESSEVNRLVEDSVAGIGKTVGKMVINCALPQHEGLYTCVATSAGRMVSAKPTMIIVEGSENVTALLETCEEADENRVRIIEWHKIALENIGQNVNLKCRAEGDPTPTVYWMDGRQNILPNSNQHYQVQPNGDLMISHLKWSDMGEYTCVATSARSRDAITTFLYPVLDDDQ